MGFASVRDGMSSLYKNELFINGKNNNAWTAGRISQHITQNTKVLTKEFNVSRILTSLPLNSKIVMKMDIEGDESVVLPDLIRTKALCRIHTMYSEYRSNYKPPLNPCLHTKIVELDDETRC